MGVLTLTDRPRRGLRRFGSFPALPVFLVYLFLAAPAMLLLDAATAGPIGVVLFVAFAVYCVARPTRRLEVFLLAAAPGALGSILHELFGISGLWGLAVLPITIGALRDTDRETARGDEASPAAATG